MIYALILQFIVWQIFAALMGYLEAILFHLADYYKLKSFNKDYRDIHFHFTIIRFAMYIMLFMHLGARNVIVFAPVAICTFSFMHDGIYYLMRNNLSPGVYSKGFFDKPSIGSTAKTKMSFKHRAIAFAFGLVLWCLLITYIY